MMKTHQLIMRGFFMVAAGYTGMALPAPVFAVEGESQFSGELTRIEGDRYTVHGDQGKD